MQRWRSALCASLLLLGLQSASAAEGRQAAIHRSDAPAALTTHAASPAKTKAPATVRSALIDGSPFGLSIEYPLLERVLGSGPCPSTALVDTLRELGAPSLRVGGDSQDLAGPNAGYLYVVPASFWTTLGCLARETKVQITVGLNFGDGTLADNLTTIAAAEQTIPASQLSFSLGNEPDIYAFSHVLPNEPEVTVPAFRAPSWSASEYAGEWASRRAALGPIRLEGPDLAGSSWRETIGRLLREDPPAQIDAHVYPAVACGSGPAATPQRLLSEHSSVGLVEKLSWLVEAAQIVKRPAIISESNSASCAGKPGLSDTPVASVWAARFVLGSLLAGFQQVRFHSAGTSYDPFVFNPDGSLTRRPLGNALFFLHRWLQPGSRITSSSTNHTKVFIVKVVHGATRSMIVTSFSSGTVELPIAIEGTHTRVRTDALTAKNAEDVSGSLAIVNHRVKLKLAPNTVVALRTN